MAENTLRAAELFPPQLVLDLFTKVQGHSTLARLSTQNPIPFAGAESFIFNLEGNAQIVGEGEQKKANKAVVTSKTIRPLKFVYQTRVSDEFMYCAEERSLQYMQKFNEGFGKKIAEGFDIAGLHGLEPYSMTDATFKATNSFVGLVTDNVITYNAETIDENLETAVETIILGGHAVTGTSLSPQAGSALGKVKINGSPQYPEFRFGGKPSSFAGMQMDVNRTLTMVGEGGVPMHAVTGDFQRSFQWGYAKNVTLEVIEYGDPDGTGRDLKAHNEVCLRAEAYIGWAILEPEAFALITEGAE